MGSIYCPRGICHSLQDKAPSLSKSNRSFGRPPLHRRSHRKSSSKGGGRKGCGSEHPRLLQQAVPCPQKGGNVETYHRSLHPQFVCSERNLQDGNPCFHSGFHPTWSLGGISGPVGCIFSYCHPSQVQKVSPLLPGLFSLPVSSPPLWPLNCSPSLHETHARGSRSSSSTRVGTSPILRRLATPSHHSSSTTDRPRSVLDKHYRPRTSSKSVQVGFDSIPDLCVCRDGVSDGIALGSSSTTSGTSYHPSCDPLYQQVTSVCSVLSLPSGSPERGSSLGGIRSTAPSPTPNLLAGSLASSSRSSFSLDSNSSHHCPSTDLVAGPVSVSQRGPPCPSTTDSFPRDRCESRRLGSSSGTSRPDDFRPLVSSGIQLPHQQFGTPYSTSGHLTLSAPSLGQVHSVVYRQHDGSFLHSETGGDACSFPISGDKIVAPSLSDTQDFSSGKISTRKTECTGRRPFPEASDPSVGVDSEPIGSESDIFSSGFAYGRPLCNKVQPSASTVCIASGRPSSLGNRRPDVELGSSLCLRLSTVCSPSGCLQEDQELHVQGTSYSTQLASEIMVQRSPEPPIQSSETSSPKPGSSLSKESNPAPRSKHVPPSRLAVVREGLGKRKFSSRVASIIAKARRPSTSTVYEAKWREFTSWCSTRKIDPIHPSIRHIADFLVFLFESKKLAVSTIKGYRAMLSNTLKFRGMKNIGTDPHLADLVRSFELSRPVCRSLTPKWDLACVLWSLTKAPFEPLDQASILHLSWKTVFLLSFASAKRRSEIHALSMEEGFLRFNNTDGSVSLMCQAGFLAKNQIPSVAPSSFVIPSLAASCGPDDNDRLLCPVRAIKFYLNRTSSFRGSRKRLFLPAKGKGDISAATISRWIASTIRHAYSHLTDRDLSFLKIRPHELRALSSSWAFCNHAPLDDIMKAAFWRNQSTFSSFYLRSFASQRDNLHSLGPLVAAQRVISQ